MRRPHRPPFRPSRSSKPFSSSSVVSRVHAFPSLRRRTPRPRPTPVSKRSQASTDAIGEVRRSALDAPTRRARRPEIGRAAWPRSRPRPSSVLMFQVKATRSRQKHSSPNRAVGGVDIARRRALVERGRASRLRLRPEFGRLQPSESLLDYRTSAYSRGFSVFISGAGSDDGDGIATPMLASV